MEFENIIYNKVTSKSDKIRKKEIRNIFIRKQEEIVKQAEVYDMREKSLRL